MKQAQSVVLHPEELNVLNVSMFHVHMAVRNRVQRLQGQHYRLNCVSVMTGNGRLRFQASISSKISKIKRNCEMFSLDW